MARIADNAISGPRPQIALWVRTADLRASLRFVNDEESADEFNINYLEFTHLDDHDFNNDGILDANDVDLLARAVSESSNDSQFDLNQDALVNSDDHTYWIKNLKNTYFGDSNLDDEFNSGDFVTVFSAGEYEDETAGNSTWATGDWNGDGDFDSGDFVLAFSAGGYEIGPRVATAVPEPSSGILLIVALIFAFARRNR